MNRKQDLLSTFLIRFVHSLSDSELKELLEDMAFYGDDRLNKVEAYRFLNMSRVTFDRKVKLGELPKGRKIAGWKEQMWSRSELSNLILAQNHDKQSVNATSE